MSPSPGSLNWRLHLDRAVNDDGLKLDKQRHTAPLWTVGDRTGAFLIIVAGLVGMRRELTFSASI